MAYVEAVVRHGQIVTAARAALERGGIARTSLRTVASEAGVPLGTLQHVFPSKEALLRAVIESVVDEMAEVLDATSPLDQGLERAIRTTLSGFWTHLVSGHSNLQIMQYELTTYALRTPGQEELARWQYERYIAVVEGWTRRAAETAGETCAIPFEQLARVIVAGIDGLILQHVCHPDESRAERDLHVFIDTVVVLADIDS
ncbi:TetR/AcrR family transcriptional regulator [Rhodococcus opacus]|uniref:TetR/AcrR family transcriptional regulator n=1 Tax=Rhodococcus opacus TaxID=37919 RepID=UPI00155A170A|nr:TetR/AcrR family transcriptional regulator [Rhodococcus opacus]